MALWGLDPDDLKGRLPAFLPDVHDVREDVADYLGECLAVDAGLGVLLARLEEKGELNNTLVVVSGDHGIPGFPRGKCNLYNLGCEVALAARWPGHIPEGRTVDDFVNLMDLAPTFLEAAGLKVHVYTSPHLVSFRERIRLGGKLIGEDHLLEVLERVEAANGDAPITFFEVTTAAAFVAFSETTADVCLLEVGLGGRLDATNVVGKPLISVITPVGLDHASFLGDDLP